MSLHSTALFSSTRATEKAACIGPQLQKMSRGLSWSPVLLLMREVNMGWVMLQKQKRALISSQLFFKWLFGILCEFLLSRNIKIIALSWAECFLFFPFFFFHFYFHITGWIYASKQNKMLITKHGFNKQWLSLLWEHTLLKIVFKWMFSLWNQAAAHAAV